MKERPPATPDAAFLEAALPFRPELRLYCYRMLGSSHDSEDVVQETLLRAWRSRDSLEHPEKMRPWLYRIATNACLDELRNRPARALVSDVCPPAEDPTARILPPTEAAAWLEPMPGAWLTGAADPSPLAKYSLKESVALAFVAALQVLTAVQRATLLLRDVVGLSAEETAEALHLSVVATKSALHRARAAIDEHRRRDVVPQPAAVDAALLSRYVRALEESDLEGLVALLREDVQTTMPPSPTWISGRAANRAFYGAVFAAFPRGTLRLRRVEANGEPAFAFYRATSTRGPHRLGAIEALAVSGGEIARIDHFMGPAVLALFPVPTELAS